MPDFNNKEITALEKAVAEFEEIINEAQSFAKEQVLSEMDEKVSSIVKDYIKNKTNKNEESAKTKINESEVKDQESANADKKEEMDTDTSKVEVSEGFETLDLTNASINEIEAAFDRAGSADQIEVVDNPPTQQSPVVDSGISQSPELPQSQPSSTSSFDDEISVDDIKSELDALEEIQSGLENSQAQQEPIINDPYQKMKQMHEELGKMIQEMENQMMESELKETFNAKMQEMWGEGFEQKIGIDECGKMFEAWKSKSQPDNGSEVAPEVQDNLVSENEIEESHGITLAHNKKVGQEKQPRIDTGKDYAADKVRVALQKESVNNAKKIAALLKENKELNKKLAQVKTEKTQISESHNKLKNSLTKMSDQMKDMAVFNTNIAYTNNLLVNEELALTKDEKAFVINQFKSVKNINESESTYKNLLEKFKSSKKTLSETTIQDIVNQGSIIGESANAKVVEKTAFETTAHVDKIKRLMGKIESKK